MKCTLRERGKRGQSLIPWGTTFFSTVGDENYRRASKRCGTYHSTRVHTTEMGLDTEGNTKDDFPPPPPHEVRVGASLLPHLPTFSPLDENIHPFLLEMSFFKGRRDLFRNKWWTLRCTRRWYFQPSNMAFLSGPTGFRRRYTSNSRMSYHCYDYMNSHRHLHQEVKVGSGGIDGKRGGIGGDHPCISPSSLPEYVIERSFDEPTIRFLFEGSLMDFKQEVREALVGVLPPPPRHFSLRRGRGEEIHFYAQGNGSFSSPRMTTRTPHSFSTGGRGKEEESGERSPGQEGTRTTSGRNTSSSMVVVDPISSAATKLLLRTLLQRGIGRVSYAMYRSSMDRLLAFYETVAMANPVLASVLAHHFTAAGLLASLGSLSLRSRYAHWLDGADSGQVLGTVATHELIAEEGPPVNTEALYDYHEQCFILRGTGKFAVVGAMIADYLVVSATLTTRKNENNGVHLFVVPLREERPCSTSRRSTSTPFTAGERAHFYPAGQETRDCSRPPPSPPPRRAVEKEGEEKTSSSSTQAPPSPGRRFSSLGSRREDIKLQAVEGEGDVFTASGVGVIYFDHTRIPADHLLGPCHMDLATGNVVYTEEMPHKGGGRRGMKNKEEEKIEDINKTESESPWRKGTEGEEDVRSFSQSSPSSFSFFSSIFQKVRSSSVLSSFTWEKVNPFPKRQDSDKGLGAMGESGEKRGMARVGGAMASHWGKGKKGGMFSSFASRVMPGGTGEGEGASWGTSARTGGTAERLNETAMEVLRYRTRLATMAISVGILKKQVRDVVQYTSQQHVIGPSGFRDYPYFGLQEVQTPLVSIVAQASLLTLMWHRYQREWLSLSTTSSEPHDYAFSSLSSLSSSLSCSSRMKWHRRQTKLMQLTGLLGVIEHLILFKLEDFRTRFTHLHGVFDSTGAGSWSRGTLQLRQEHHNHQERLREVARSSVVFNIGSTHWGWRVSSLARRFPWIQRFVQNPLYSPRIADLGRHYLFFSHKHYGLKKRLQRAVQLETRRGGVTDAWHDWRTFRHADVLRCGEAYMEVYMMAGIMEEVQHCTGDLRARKLLRDVGWIFALSRQEEHLGYYLSTGQLSRQKGLILTPHLENLCTVMAPQCRHVAEALCGRWYEERGMGERGGGEDPWGGNGPTTPPTSTPASMRTGIPQTRRMAAAAAALCNAPCGSESYWTIIGATTRPERGESLTTTTSTGERRGSGEGREREEEGMKEAEERVQEDPREWDMLHGLGEESQTTSRRGRKKG